jgi:hypothetical protein
MHTRRPTLVAALAVVGALLGPSAPVSAQPATRAPTLRVVDAQSWVGSYSDGNSYYFLDATFRASSVRGAVVYHLYSRFDGGSTSLERSPSVERPGPVTIPFHVEPLDLVPHDLEFWVVACADFSDLDCTAASNVVTVHVPT